ncbi:MAG: acyl-CoA dehydrogenase C-terminal domain-containing protein, partial [Rhodocyclaceae bacterium]|nr:acyl-CoA dehydrogenase C-terminal domain-containing protein [Rhodocyclaceae bacterium]
LFGIVAGGWLMARAAVIAQKKLAAGEGDAAFYKAKIATTRFYADHILAMAPALSRVVTEGAEGVMALEEDSF